MNYLKVYCNLIRKAENRTPPEGYTEKHHTFPVSIFGKNNRIVVLTAREHYIAHALLEKAFIKRYGLHHYRTQKMNFAHSAMKCKNQYTNSYLYENARKRRIQIMREQKMNCGENHPLYGKSPSEETRRKIGEAMKGKLAGEKNPMYSKSHSEETKRKQSEAMRGKYDGEKHPRYGKKHSEETKIKQSKSGKDKVWWNNGTTNTRSVKCPGEGWVLGMNEESKRTKSEAMKGKGEDRKWWNDGNGNTKFSKKYPGEGWVSGRGNQKKKS